MPFVYVIVLYGCLFVGVFLLVDALAGFLRSARGKDDDAVDRRLLSSATGVPLKTTQALIRAKGFDETWGRFIPFLPQFIKLLQGSGTGLTVQRALMLMAIFSVLFFVPFVLLLPALLPVWMFVAPVSGIGLIILYLVRARAKRIAKFEEQLPDAIDLIVRSLKVGHPLSGAMGVVGRELPTPISTEFAAAADEVSYGQDIPTAFAKMAERVAVPDLGYFSMAIQIQQESGGNLVESLSKLSQVIRERFRMFRKVKALTAEGRFSAWFLSMFPFFLIFAIQLIKPDYYTQVMNVPIFPQLVAATVILLTINIIAMRVITNIKV